VFDLDCERLTLTVRQGKGRKDRMIPTGPRAAAWAARYLSDARPKLATEPDDGTLFLTVDGTPFGVDRLRGLVAGYVRRSGVGKPGADISTTQIYPQVALRQLRVIHAATHPATANTSRRVRGAAGRGDERPAAAFDTDVLHPDR